MKETVYKCDRCREVIGDEAHHVDSAPSHWDLCDRCMEGLLKYMQEYNSP